MEKLDVEKCVCVCVLCISMYICEYLHSNSVHKRTLKSNSRSSVSEQILNSKNLPPLREIRDPQRNG